MNSEFELYKACYVDNVRFYETEYYDKKFYYMHVYPLVVDKILTLYFRQGDDIRELKRKAELYYKGEMKRIDVCRCFVQLEQKYYVRDESGKFIQIDKYPIYAGVYPVENSSYDFMHGKDYYNFMHGNDPTSQCDQLKKRGVLVLPVDGKLPSAYTPFCSRELSLDDLLK